MIYMVVDLKTGNSAVTAKQAKENPQLMTYQLALERGELVGVVDTADTEPGENPALRRSSVLVKACRAWWRCIGLSRP